MQAPLARSADLTNDDNVLIVIRVDPGERAQEAAGGDVDLGDGADIVGLDLLPDQRN